MTQRGNPCQSTWLLLGGRRRLTSLSAVIRGDPVSVRGRKRPNEVLFNLEQPEELAAVTEVNEDGNDEYSQCRARLRGIREYAYRMDILER